MPFYEAYGAVLSSALPLPELAADATGSPDLTIAFEDGRPADDDWRRAAPWHDESGGPWLSVAASPRGYRLNFEGGGDFVVSADARRITAFAGSTPLETLRHLLIDQVVPLVLGHLGHLVLHAAAFMTERGAVALAGPAGSGKSTLSASLGARGVPLLADDALVLEPRGGAWFARPAYAGLRVWPDVVAAVRLRDVPPVAPYTDKRRVGAGDGLPFAATPAPLDRIYVLGYEEAETITIRALAGRDALMALVTQTLTMDPSDTGRAVGQFDRAHRLCCGVPVRRLSYPRQLSALDDVHAAILGDGTA